MPVLMALDTATLIYKKTIIQRCFAVAFNAMSCYDGIITAQLAVRFIAYKLF